MTRDQTVEDFMAAEGALGRSANDEPVFVLVARDRFAADTVREWVARVHALGRLPLDHPKLVEAMQIAEEMDAWRNEHGGGKIPD